MSKTAKQQMLEAFVVVTTFGMACGILIGYIIAKVFG